MGYLSFKLSYRDLVTMMGERGIVMAHTTILRWVQHYSPEFERRWRRYARSVGGSWRMDETYVPLVSAPSERNMERMDTTILVWVVCGVAAAFIAENRGVNGFPWFLIGILLEPFGLAFAFISGSERVCLACRKRVHPKATVCPYCQSAISTMMPD